MKKCSKCGKEKSLEEFYNRERDKSGKQSECKLCHLKVSRIYRKKNKLEFPLKYILWGAKHRAKKNGIPFDLTEDGLEIPEICPVYGEPFVFGTGNRDDFSPSIDRISSSKGYTKDNIIIVSWKANRLKNNATIEDLLLLANFYKKFKKES